jgi:hypothetical protein
MSSGTLQRYTHSKQGVEMLARGYNLEILCAADDRLLPVDQGAGHVDAKLLVVKELGVLVVRVVLFKVGPGHIAAGPIQCLERSERKIMEYGIQYVDSLKEDVYASSVEAATILSSCSLEETTALPLPIPKPLVPSALKSHVQTTYVPSK